MCLWTMECGQVSVIIFTNFTTVAVYGHLPFSQLNGHLYYHFRHGSIRHDDVIKCKHFPRYCLLCGEITGHRWIPHTKASDAELWCSLLNQQLSKQWRNRWFGMPWCSLWRHCMRSLGPGSCSLSGACTASHTTLGIIDLFHNNFSPSG